MPGLGTSFGRGGATTAQQDLANADCILIEGSSMAEAHPVGFRWVMQAKERGATIIHVDPRFSRTSALADIWVPLRASFFTKLRRRSSPHQVRIRAQRFVMRSAGPNIQKAFRSFAPRRSCNYCSATSVARAAAFSRSAVMRQFKVRPTFRRSTILCLVICQCPAAMAPKRRCAITWRVRQSQLVSGIVFQRIHQLAESVLRQERNGRK